MDEWLVLASKNDTLVLLAFLVIVSAAMLISDNLPDSVANRRLSMFVDICLMCGVFLIAAFFGAFD